MLVVSASMSAPTENDKEFGQYFPAFPSGGYLPPPPFDPYGGYWPQFGQYFPGFPSDGYLPPPPFDPYGGYWPQFGQYFPAFPFDPYFPQFGTNSKSTSFYITRQHTDARY